MIRWMIPVFSFAIGLTACAAETTTPEEGEAQTKAPAASTDKAVD